MIEEKLMFIDVRKAHLNPTCDDEEWVELPEEFWSWGRYAKLKRWLYGMRKAASAWEEDYVDKLLKVGFKRDKSASTVFWNETTGVRLVVHGDDFTFSGEEHHLNEMKRLMGDWYEIKDRGTMGSGTFDIKEVVILGRRLRWTKGGLEYEADPKHRKDLMKDAGLDEGSKAATGPAVKERAEDEQAEAVELQDAGEKTKFRGGAAKLNYLGLDRPDLQFAAKGIAQKMAVPSMGGDREN